MVSKLLRQFENKTIQNELKNITVCTVITTSYSWLKLIMAGDSKQLALPVVVELPEF
jgi:hypothetical protein